MQLTQYTDYSLRVLIYLGSKPGGFGTISEITDFYGISRNHLTKIVNHLANHGLLVTTRGKHGGIRLAKPPGLIRIGQVIQLMEPNFNIAECFNGVSNSCVITRNCGLKGVLKEGVDSFLAVMDKYTLEDIVKPGLDSLTESVVKLPRRSVSA
ncbi:MAG: Rrf2 family transcriptional regulator [Proteobacteria bacterium]|nr:Rrf2 family transcriptional regulator [Pseudomonadota bacterium]MDE3207286.1 Rrf2 family transcriptional regulator [Pseudomonadota bacterium]